MVLQEQSLPKFSINGRSYEVTKEIPPTVRLVRFIREWAHLTGTKAMCHEGGCNLCSVVVTKYDITTGSVKTFSVPSCQVLVYSCDGWKITTIEHLGNRYDGYHPIQKAIVEFYGTQCGYCTPGMVMTMYGQTQSGKDLTMADVEKSLDGNLCRCTGYRPILDGFKSLAVDADSTVHGKLDDIEDLALKTCSKTKKPCSGSCGDSGDSTCSKKSNLDQEVVVQGTEWYWPSSVESLAKIILKKSSNERIRLVAGNTAQGVYKNDGPYNAYIDTNGIPDFHQISMESPITIGANVTLAKCIEVFDEVSKTDPSYDQLGRIAKHWKFVANTGIRNIATWAGNVMMKHEHREFPSDIFLTLTVLGVKIKIFDPVHATEEVSLEELFEKDLSRSFIISMTIPPQKGYQIRTYKITKRAVNSHAYVNAAFKFRLGNKITINEKPTILFGGINPNFIHATKTEEFLVEKSPEVDPNLPAKAAEILCEELVPDENPVDASPKYRKDLATCLLYKALVDIMDGKASPYYQSAGPILTRPLSHGIQTFDVNSKDWPIGEPIPKLESYWQASGEAEYIDDIPLQYGELHGAFVQTTIANARLEYIIDTEALKLPGVVDFITAKDIPGKNSFLSTSMYLYPEVLFADTVSKYAGQAVGLIVAESRDIALEAVKLVEIGYSSPIEPILTIKDSVRSSRSTFEPTIIENANENSLPSNYYIEGEVEFGSQYHFYTECMAAIVVPKEEGYDVWASTQFADETQAAVAEVLNIEANRLNFIVRRLGGAFGGKISRGNVAACGAAIAAYKLRRPVRIVLPLDVNMTLVGWREPYLSKYKVSVSKDGLLNKVEVDYTADIGVAENDTSVETASLIPGPYYAKNWKLNPKCVLTDTAANTWCRTPGFVEASATMESIIEHVASELKMEPSIVRELNFSKVIKSANAPLGENKTASEVFPQLKSQAEYTERKKFINQFNKENRWKKRGISILPLLYAIDYATEKFQVQVVIYSADGSVAISHGGIEMGQGINTKVAQVAAKILDIPVDLIKVKATNSFVGANSSMCAGSLGTDLCAYGAKVCCERLISRISDVKSQMLMRHEHNNSWSEIIKKCYDEGVDLSERYWTTPMEHPKGYNIFGSACVEVEVDVLTGQFLILRADIIEDVGRSMSPLIDVGQVEGSMVMSFGLFSSEEVKFDKTTGQKVTRNTWDYKVPSAMDIPIDFRVSFLRNGDNPFGVVRSKATGEPAVCLGFCLVTALRHAIKSAREDAGYTDYFQMNTPLTAERIHNLCTVQPSDFVTIGKDEEHIIKSNL